MALKLANNAVSTIAAPVSMGATTITIAAADAGRFPALAVGDWFPLYILDSAGNREIVKVTARAGSSLTVVRAQEGTTAKAFPVGARVDLRFTAAAANEVLGPHEHSITEVVGLTQELANISEYADTKVATGRTENNVTTIICPAGATYSGPASPTGALKITLPQSWTNTMLTMRLEVHSYAQFVGEIVVGGYTFASTPIWANTFAYLVADGSVTAMPVRFGHDGAKCCIWLGDATTAWSYPRIRVANVMAGHTNQSVAQWQSGWSISLVAAFAGTVNATVTASAKATLDNLASTRTSAIDAAILAAAPPGAIMAFARNSAPAGWLKANGAAISRTTYADLFGAIGATFGAGDGSTTFALPNLRGEFIRGWDDARGVDSGRVFGSAQGDALQNVIGSVNVEAGGSSGVFNDPSGVFGVSQPVDGKAVREFLIAGSRHRGINIDLSRVARTATETRPRNIALLYCIKF